MSTYYYEFCSTCHFLLVSILVSTILFRPMTDIEDLRQHPIFIRTEPYLVCDCVFGQQEQDAKLSFSANDVERQMGHEIKQKDINYSKRAQWLRAAVLGANDGLVSTASLMMGVGAVKPDIKTMILTGFAGLVAGACSMAIGEFVSVYSQLDIEVAQMERDNRKAITMQRQEAEEEEGDKESLPNPLQAAVASALAFSVGALVPLLAASFIREYKLRLGAIVAAVTAALVLFGWLGAVLGKAPRIRSSARVLFGGWLAMAITFGLTKLIGSSGL
ncbi:vacuolar iron transporter homolog 2-like [Coffea arabica]|uniref:Vacuolar iron transporter n=1 Tax=Coffea arabica TaxID=13443 RepID=A0A6P6UMS4_COFAR